MKLEDVEAEFSRLGPNDTLVLKFKEEPYLADIQHFQETLRGLTHFHGRVVIVSEDVEVDVQAAPAEAVVVFDHCNRHNQPYSQCLGLYGQHARQM